MERKGSTEPSYFPKPLRRLTRTTSYGYECCEFLEKVVGWELLPWQRWLYIHALEKDLDNKNYRFNEICLLIARQNGKTRWIMGLALYKLYLDGAELIVQTAQTLDYAVKAVDEANSVIEENKVLSREWLGMSRSNGKDKIKFTGRREWLAKAPTRHNARSLSCDLVILDELREHQDYEAYSAFTPTIIARPRGQVVCASNAGDATSIVLRNIREQALKDIKSGNENPGVALFEWSADPDGDPYDVRQWAKANPSMGYTIPVREIEKASRRPLKTFKTEHLCQWVEVIDEGPFPRGAWDAIRDDTCAPGDNSPAWVGVDVSFDRSMAYIAVSYTATSGKLGVEIIAQRAGTDWVIPWLTSPDRETWFNNRVAFQNRGAPVSSLIDDFTAAGIEVLEWGGPELTKGFGKFYDRVINGTVCHRGQPVLDLAASTAATRTVADSWLIDRKNSKADVAPLIAAIAAVWHADLPVAEVVRSAYEDYDDTDYDVDPDDDYKIFV